MVKGKNKRKENRKQARIARRKVRSKNKKGESRKMRVPQIGPNTSYDLCTQRLSAFGGLLPLVKFLDLIGFEEIFERVYVSPKRKTKLGCYRMVLGILMLLFSGLQRKCLN